MIFGYTLLDPLVVLLGTALAIRLLATDSVRLVAYLPAALSVYFFIPTVTLLTLWQVVPMLLVLRVFLRGRITVPSSVRPVFGLFALVLFASAGYGFIPGSDTTRASIRVFYYLGVFGLFAFAYEMGRHQKSYVYLLRGFAVLAGVFAIYGVYQIVAYYTGLPFRGIVYGPSGAGFPVINGLPRINSLANEPKRLGFVLFVGALAFFELARHVDASRRTRYQLYGAFILAVSVLTFSSSYFISVAAFGVAALLLYPKRSVRYVIPVIVASAIVWAIGNQLGLGETLANIFDSRYAELELGLDAKFVYRQEFYARDYLLNHPWAILTGVGVGQYYSVLFSEYGVGVGYNEYGGLMPLNSMLLELLFDLGGLVTVPFYILLGMLVLKLRRSGLRFLTLALLYLTLQSLSIQTLHFQMLIAGLALGQLRIKSPVA
ncbi:MAG TPA: hypothetical protein DIU07_16880 [Rhodobacteraceae bacterium]|nr:hypothetical protein [Paracoccaceae bacterium]